MALLDRFKTKPLWQHEDPSVRAEAVRSLPAAERETILALFQGDPDPLVRKAALRRIGDVATLVGALREDAEPAIREEASALLLKLASESADAAAASTAAEALSEARHLVSLARGSRHAAVREAALARLADARSLGSVAKTADDAAIRLAALARLEDAAALADVALKTEHRDAAMAALERIQDPEALKEIAAHGRHKAAARRARALLERLTGHAQAITPEERRSRAHAIQHGLEGLQTSTEWERVAEELSGAEAEWAGLGELSDLELQRRFETSRDLLRSRLESHEREEATARQQARALDRGLSARRMLCQRLETLTGDDAPVRLEDTLAEWRALEPIDSPEVAELQARFTRAETGCRERHERWTKDEARRTRAAEIAAELEALTAPESANPARAKELRREWEKLRADGPVSNEAELAVRAALGKLGERTAQAKEQRAQSVKENQERLEELCSRAETLAKAETPSLKDAERCLREIRSALATPGPLPGKKERDALAERLKAARAALYPRVQELREAEDWKRWANVSVQQELCAEMEALVGEADLDKAARELGRLQERWRQFSQARKEEAAGLWERFKGARDQVQARVAEHLKKKAAEEAENLRRKEELCVRAETLAGSTDWLKTADELKKIQAEWKAIGPVPHRKSKALWDRFHGACDRFFTTRKQDLDKRKHDWAENLEKKEALCVRAEALAASSEWEQTAAEIRKLQAEWKAIGPVRKNKSDAVWNRFRGACDQFFERYKRRDEIASAEHLAAREALVAELEALLPQEAAVDPAAAPEGLAGLVQERLARWRQSPPLPREALEPLERRLHASRDRLVESWPEAFKGTDLDPEVNRTRLDKLCAKVEALARAHASHGNGTESLAERLREALATNAMGGRAAFESRWRAAADEVEQARAAWKRVGPVPGETGRELAERFRKACSQVLAARPR